MVCVLHPPLFIHFPTRAQWGCKIFTGLMLPSGRRTCHSSSMKIELLSPLLSLPVLIELVLKGVCKAVSADGCYNGVNWDGASNRHNSRSMLYYDYLCVAIVIVVFISATVIGGVDNAKRSAKQHRPRLRAEGVCSGSNNHLKRYMYKTATSEVDALHHLNTRRATM
jgi:hypothetical protein